MNWERVKFISGVSRHGFIKTHTTFPSSGWACGVVCVLRDPVPDEMGKYNCFPLGNTLFYSLIKDLFYLCCLLCSCACVHMEISCYHSVFEHRPWGGSTQGTSNFQVVFIPISIPSCWDCSHVFSPGKPSQENFDSEQ